MSGLIAQIGFHVGGSVPIALSGMPGLGTMATFYILFIFICVPAGVLLGIWATIGDKPTPWRFVCIVAVSVALLCLRRDFLTETVFLILFLMIATSLAMFAARVAGVRLERVSRNASSNWGRIKMIRRKEGLKETDSASAEPPTLQFSLWSLMSWTAAFAVLLSSLRVLHVAVFASAAPASVVGWQSLVIGIAAFSPVMLVILWVALATGWLEARIIACVVISAIALFATSAMPFPHGAVLMIVCIIMAAVLIGSLRVFRRLTGYCLVWRKPAVWSLFRGTRRRI